MRRSYVIALTIAVVAGAWLATGQIGKLPAAPAPDGQEPSSSQGSPAATSETTGAAGQPPSASEIKPIRVQVIDSEATEQERAVVLRGRTDADRVVDVSAQTSGVVTAVPIEKGSRVRTGDILAVLDGADRASRLAEARALLQQRETESQASRTLSEQGYAPKLNLPDLAAKVALARAAVASMEVEVGYLQIAAPIDGTLDERAAEVGSFLDRGDLVGTVVDLDPIVVVGNVAEQDVGHLSLGATAEVRLLDGRKYTGAVRFIASRSDESTRTFRIEVAVPNTDYQILDGLSAELILPIGQVMAHRLSPAVLSLDDNGAIGIKMVDEQNRVRFAPVEIIREDEHGVWLKGLPDRAKVIVVGQDFVVEGQLVVPVMAAGVGG
jgi:multidrug efflux system membrane fusion protein